MRWYQNLRNEWHEDGEVLVTASIRDYWFKVGLVVGVSAVIPIIIVVICGLIELLL